MDWFTVDKEGLANLLERKGKASAVLELIQNAWDAVGVNRVDITLVPTARGRARLVVTDDAPDGFKDLTHAFTLFAPSEKVNDAEKRGRFNLGEKLVLAICDDAEVSSTTGSYRFTKKGRTRGSMFRASGSCFSANIRLNRAEQEEVAALIYTLLPPHNIWTTFNGHHLVGRDPVRTLDVNLPTEQADVDGVLRRTRRNTQIRLFEPVGDETPHIYELGIPVVEYDGKFHADVQQKVPLTFERDNVTPAYLRELYVNIVNGAHDLLNKDDATTDWVKIGVGDHRAEERAVVDITTKRYGEKAVAFDPSDPQANKEAVLKGYTVVPGGAMSRDEWRNVKSAGVLRPAGQVTPSNSSVFSSPDGEPPIDRAEWTVGIERVADYAQRLAKHLLEVDVSVEVYRIFGLNKVAWYGPGTLSLNLSRLGHRWFDEPDQAEIDALFIHEFAHHRVRDHLSEAFHDECCRLGARMRGWHGQVVRDIDVNNWPNRR